ncbi:MAG: hypothetical protein WD079_05690, partial [Phycisphaeraceae bacterium]
NFEAFDIGYAYLHWEYGAFNTLVLLASSFTMAWAVRAIQLNQQALCFTLMGLTLLGGVIFMGVKYIEYDEKFSAGMGPGIFYEAPERAVKYFAEHPEATEVAGVAESPEVGSPEVPTPAAPPRPPTPRRRATPRAKQAAKRRPPRTRTPERRSPLAERSPSRVSLSG